MARRSRSNIHLQKKVKKQKIILKPRFIKKIVEKSKRLLSV